MIRKLAKIILILSLIASVPSHAFAADPSKALGDFDFDPESTASLPNSGETIFQKYIHDMYSPFVNPTTFSLFVGGTVSTLTLLATGENFEDKALERASAARPLGDTSQIGDVAGQLVPNVAYFLFYEGKYIFTKDPLSQFRAELMFRATLAATSMSTILKTVVREPRPGVPNELTSFPSGHSTSIFAFATVAAAMHGPYWGGAAYALATFVAFSRMNDNRHRLHDVVAGATLGSMYGLAVYQRMRESTIPSLRMAKKFDYEVIPVATDDGAMLGISGTF